MGQKEGGSLGNELLVQESCSTRKLDKRVRDEDPLTWILLISILFQLSCIVIRVELSRRRDSGRETVVTHPHVTVLLVEDEGSSNGTSSLHFCILTHVTFNVVLRSRSMV